MAADPLEDCTGFDWDDADAHKNWERHQVTPEEAEDIFFNEPLVVGTMFAVRNLRSDTTSWVKQTLAGDCLLFSWSDGSSYE